MLLHKILSTSRTEYVQDNNLWSWRKVEITEVKKYGQRPNKSMVRFLIWCRDDADICNNILERQEFCIFSIPISVISWIQSRALGISFDLGLQWLAVKFVLLFWLICETADFCLYSKMKGVPFLWFIFAVFYCCSLYNVWRLSSFFLFFV